MILQIFSIFDQAAQAYLPPFFLPSKGLAIRGFSDTCNDPNSNINRHPADFTLFQIGTYDDATGVIKQDGHVNLGVGVEFHEQKQNNLMAGNGPLSNLDAG